MLDDKWARLPGRRLWTLFLAILLAGAALPASAQLVISEFRLRGPNGASDEFIEIYNNSDFDHIASASSGTGYAVAASDGVVRCTIVSGTVIPARGHFLCVNSVGYSLASYPAGSGTATGDATYATDIPDNAGIALFNNNTGGGNFTLANRFDAVGSTSEANTLYKEGTGYPALTPFSIDYAWVRDSCGKGGAVNLLGPCTISSPKDTDDNAADFYFVDTNGTSAGGGQRLGAPGPENQFSPLGGSTVANAPLDSCATLAAGTANYVRDFTSDPANNSTFGTLDIRRTITNNGAAALTRLRFRIVDLDTFPAASGFADLRPRTSTSLVVTVDRPPCGSGTSNVTVQGTTLEQPPSQPNGGGFNSSMGAGVVALATPLAPGASVDLRFLFGIQQTGNFRLALITEGLPTGGDLLMLNPCTTDGGCVPPVPTVSSIVRADANPTAAATVHFTVTFSESVTGVDTGDFALTTTGTIAGASVIGVSGSGATYTATVGTGTGDGTIRLDVVDDDSILNAGLTPLGGAGAGNGNFNAGELYTVSVPPAVVSIARIGTSPTSASSIQFTVTFSEAVVGVDVTDFALTTTGTVMPTITTITGSGATRVVTVGTGGGAGTIRLDLVDNDSIVDFAGNPLGGVGAGNGSYTAAGEVFTIVLQAASEIPALDPRGLALLAILLAGAGYLVQRRF